MISWHKRNVLHECSHPKSGPFGSGWVRELGKAPPSCSTAWGFRGSCARCSSSQAWAFAGTTPVRLVARLRAPSSQSSKP